MAKILINDLFEELREENNRLINDLIFSQKCVKFLEKYRKCLLEFNNNCICEQNIRIKTKLIKLENNYKTINEKIDKKQDLNEYLLNGKQSVDSLDKQNLVKIIDIKSLNDSLKKEELDTSNGENEDNLKEELVSNDRPKRRRSKPKRFEFIVDKCEVKSDSDSEFAVSDVELNSGSDSNEEIGNKSVENTLEVREESNNCLKNKQKLRQKIGTNTRKKNRYPQKTKHVCTWIGCDKQFTERVALMAHIRAIHKNEKPFKCWECDKRFQTKNSLLIHKNCHNSENNRFNCTYTDCQFHTLYERDIQRHLESHKNREDFKSIECFECNRFFHNIDRLTTHQQLYHNSNFKYRYEELGHRKRRFFCEWNGCGQEFPSITSLFTHYGRKHINEKTLKCPDCEKRFFSFKCLKSHTKSHALIDSNGPVVMVKCDYNGCEYECLTRDRMRNHKKIHSNVSYKCDEIGCDVSCKTVSSLSQHKKVVHSDDRPYACEWPGCEVRFKQNKALTVHKMRHKNERAFKCHYEGCGKSYNVRCHLTRHIQWHENTHRSVVCSWPACDYRTDRQIQLKKHMNRHLNLKPYKCHFESCGKKFFHEMSLDKHLKAIHNSN